MSIQNTIRMIFSVLLLAACDGGGNAKLASPVSVPNANPRENPATKTDKVEPAPTGLSATMTKPKQVDLTWKIVSGSKPVEYLIEENISGDAQDEESWSELIKIVAKNRKYSDMDGHTNKIYRVRSVNAQGVSEPSNIAKVGAPIGGAAKRLIFSGPLSLSVNSCGSYGVELKNESGDQVSTLTELNLVISATGLGQIYSDSGCTAKISNLMLAPGTSSKMIYLKSTGVASVSISATHSTLSSSPFVVEVVNANTLTVSSVNPSSAPSSGGTTVSVSGSNFASGAKVKLNGKEVATSFISASQLTFVSSAESAGALTLVVNNPDGSVSNSSVFTITAPRPILNSLSITSVPVAGNTLVNVFGNGFSPGAVVKINNDTLAATYFSTTQLSFLTPAHTAGAVDITVRNSDGAESDVLKLNYAGEVNQSAPVLSSLSPNSGTIQGGYYVNLTGSNFLSGSVVKMEGVTGDLATTFYSSSQLVAVFPSHASGAVSIRVVTPLGLSSNSISFTYGEPGVSGKLHLNGLTSLPVNTCGRYTVHHQNSAGTDTALNSNLLIDLAVGDGPGRFYNDVNCTQPTTQVSIIAGSSSREVFFKSENGFSSYIRLNASGLSVASFIISNSSPAGLKSLVITGPSSLLNNTCGAYAIEARNDAGALTPPASNLPVTLSAVGGTGKIFSDVGCSSPISSLSLTPQVNRLSFYFKFLDGGSTRIQASAFGLPTALLEARAQIPEATPGNLSFESGSIANFNSVILGNPRSKGARIINTGGSPAKITGSSFSGVGFGYGISNVYPGIEGSCPDPIPAGHRCSIVIEFTPRAIGTTNGKLALQYTPKNGQAPVTLNLDLTGVGIVPALTVTSDDFGNVAVGSTAQNKKLTVTNGTEHALTRFSIGSLSAPFSVVSNTCSNYISGNISCEIVIGYKPISAVRSEAALNISYQDGLGNNYIASGTVRGNGTTAAIPIMSFNNGLFDFGKVSKNKSSPAKILTITNTGTVPVKFSITEPPTGPFGYAGGVFPGIGLNSTGTCSSEPLAVGKSCTIYFVYTPIDKTSRQSSVRFVIEGNSVAKRITLLGEGR